MQERAPVHAPTREPKPAPTALVVGTDAAAWQGLATGEGEQGLTARATRVRPVRRHRRPGRHSHQVVPRGVDLEPCTTPTRLVPGLAVLKGGQVRLAVAGQAGNAQVGVQQVHSHAPMLIQVPEPQGTTTTQGSDHRAGHSRARWREQGREASSKALFVPRCHMGTRETATARRWHFYCWARTQWRPTARATTDVVGPARTSCCTSHT